MELERCPSLRLSNATYGATELAPDGRVTDSTRMPGTVAVPKRPCSRPSSSTSGSAPSSLAQTSSGNNLPQPTHLQDDPTAAEAPRLARFRWGYPFRRVGGVPSTGPGPPL